MSAAPQYFTLRYMVELLTKRGETLEQVMDLPLSIGVSDGHRNFEICTPFRDYPMVDMPREGYAGSIRIDCHTTRKRLVEERSK